MSNLEGIELPLSSISYAENNYWVFGIVLNDDIPTDANHVMSLLSQEQIGTRPFFWSMHEQPVLTRLGLFEADHIRYLNVFLDGAFIFHQVSQLQKTRFIGWHQF